MSTMARPKAVPEQLHRDEDRDGPADEISSTNTSSVSPSTLRQRPALAADAQRDKMDDGRPFLDGTDDGTDDGTGEVAAATSGSWTSKNQWVVFAVASGACAALNGAFAKLTTNDLTSLLSQWLAGAFGLSAFESVIEIIFRFVFFGLNLIFNGIMWTLFTKALARGDSTTQVSIINTSANFMITAFLGLIIFSESLPPLWWLGAAMLVAGNVIIGRKDEGSAEEVEEEDAVSVPESGTILATYGALPQPDLTGLLPEVMDSEDSEDEDVALIGDVGGSDSR